MKELRHVVFVGFARTRRSGWSSVVTIIVGGQLKWYMCFGNSCGCLMALRVRWGGLVMPWWLSRCVKFSGRWMFLSGVDFITSRG